MAFTGGLSLGEVCSVINERSLDGSNLERIAYVDTNPDLPRDMAEFAELVALNRGVNVRLFSTLSEAEQWLQSSEPLADPAHANRAARESGDSAGR